jgi:hypothetical protein
MKNDKSIDRTAVWFDHVDQHVDALVLASLQASGTPVPANLGARLDKLVKVYNGIKPLLTVVVALPGIPPNWRAALTILTQAVDSVASAPELVTPKSDAGFKAGKDI